MFDEDLPEQLVAREGKITPQTREWATLCYYFCCLRMPAGYEPIARDDITDVDCTPRGRLNLNIEDHSSMRADPYYDVWNFFRYVKHEILDRVP